MGEVGTGVHGDVQMSAASRSPSGSQGRAAGRVVWGLFPLQGRIKLFAEYIGGGMSQTSGHLT